MSNDNLSPEDFKDKSIKHNANKFEYDLYHDEDNKIEKVTRIKHIRLPNDGDRWKVFEDSKVIFILEGNKLNKIEKDFLKSVNGSLWLLAQAKIGIKSLNSLKKNLKEKLP